MKKIILKTAEEARKEREEYKEESTCPACGEELNFGLRARKPGGLFKRDQERKEYSCFRCGTKWATEWQNF